MSKTKPSTSILAFFLFSILTSLAIWSEGSSGPPCRDIDLASCRNSSEMRLTTAYNYCNEPYQSLFNADLRLTGSLLIPDGIYAAWCLDPDKLIIPQDFPGSDPYFSVSYYSTLKPIALPVPYDQATWNKVNWILNYRFRDSDGNPTSDSTKPANPWYVIQLAMWRLIDRTFSLDGYPYCFAETGWEDWVTNLLTAANANGGFIPGPGQKFAIITLPVDLTKIDDPKTQCPVRSQTLGADTQTVFIEATVPCLELACPAVTKGEVGVPYNSALVVRGGTGTYKYSLVGGNLPDGLSLNELTGVITGVPTISGSFSFVAQVMDSSGAVAKTTASCPITISQKLTLSCPGITPVGEVGVPYSVFFKANGGSTPYTYSISQGSLPPGLILDMNTGEVRGTPTAAGTYKFKVKVMDSLGATAETSAECPISVTPPSKTFTIGPSSMEGAIKISNGDWVNGGYSFKFKNKSHSATDFTIGAKVTITGPCSNGGTDTVTVSLGNVTYSVPAGNTDWLPTGDANSVLSWQGSVRVGVTSPAICGGVGKLDASKGAVYTAKVSQDPATGSLVDFRFKYRDPAAKGKPNTNCLDTSDPNRNKADVCGASWSGTKTDP